LGQSQAERIAPGSRSRLSCSQNTGAGTNEITTGFDLTLAAVAPVVNALIPALVLIDPLIFTIEKRVSHDPF